MDEAQVIALIEQYFEMYIPKVSINSLPLLATTDELTTLGTDANNRSVRVPIENFKIVSSVELSDIEYPEII